MVGAEERLQISGRRAAYGRAGREGHGWGKQQVQRPWGGRSSARLKHETHGAGTVSGGRYVVLSEAWAGPGRQGLLRGEG